MKRLMGTVAILALVLGFGYIFFANPHIPLLDAGRRVLAENYLEAYCAGVTFGENPSYEGMPTDAADCRAEFTAFSQVFDLSAVQPAFCQGYGSKTGFPVNNCLTIMGANEYWPVKAGTITNDWNRAFPYPGRRISNSAPIDSRGNDRDTNQRTDTDSDSESYLP